MQMFEQLEPGRAEDMCVLQNLYSIPIAALDQQRQRRSRKRDQNGFLAGEKPVHDAVAGFIGKPAREDRVVKKLKLQERRAVIPSRRSLAACRPLGFLGRLRAPSRIGGHTRGTYGVGTYPGLHYGDGGAGAAAAE